MNRSTDKFLTLFQEAEAHLEQLLPLGQRRQKARATFERVGFPMQKMEKWRNSHLRTIRETDWVFERTQPAVDKTQWPERFRHAPVFVNGVAESDDFWEERADGVQIGSLRAALKHTPQRVFDHFNKNNKEDLFGTFALNTLLVTDGLWVYVPKGIRVETPVLAVQYSSGKHHAVNHLHHILVVEEAASVDVQMLQISTPDDNHFIQDITECFVGDRGVIRRHVLQQFQGETICFSTAFSTQGEASEYHSNVTTLSSHNTRNEQHTRFDKPDGVARLGGLYLAAEKERVEHQVFIDHAVPDCESHEKFAGVLSGHAQGAFTGHILVREDAQKTNAFQASNNMVLSDDARVRSLPFLEIYADDVKCSHGATVGKLDDEALFYLRSRGIGAEEAKRILLTSFAAATLEDVEDENYKQFVVDEIQSKLAAVSQ